MSMTKTDLKNLIRECICEAKVETKVPKELWHGSFRPNISKFKPLTHFGTKQSAWDRLMDLNYELKRAKKVNPKHAQLITAYGFKENKGILYKVTLDMKNPVVVKDSTLTESRRILKWIDDIVKSNIEAEKLLHSNYSLWSDIQYKLTVPVFVKFIQTIGHDGLAYMNTVEDFGETSYVILYTDQVRIVGKEKVFLDGWTRPEGVK